MHAVNHSVIESMVEWLTAGEGCWLATVVETWGASPRPAGSLFAFNARQDKLSGSLSSGCIEDELLSELREMGDARRPFWRSYGNGETSSVALPCGGTLSLILEWHSEGSLAHFSSILKALNMRRSVARTCNLKDGRLSDQDSYSETEVISVTGDSLKHRLGPVERLLILGWSEPARYLIPIAETLEFDVALCEPRQEVIARAKLPRAARLYSDILPDDLVASSFNDAHCAIVALAHDPRVDDLGLIAALDGPAFYVGALGSVNTSINRRDRLVQLGVKPASISRLHAPIGLDIESKTPPEIAISIAAQLVAARAKRFN